MSSERIAPQGATAVSNGETAAILRKCHQFTQAAEAREQGLYPYFRPMEENLGSRVVIEGKTMIMAGSNNYLGLAQDPRVMEAAREAITRFGTSNSGSYFLNGTLVLHKELEEKLADFVGKEAALCFTTGYSTNLGAISSLVGRRDHVVTDKYNHASIMDGIFLTSGLNREVNVHRYKHNDMVDLERRLAGIPSGESVLIVTDGVFSMEGDIARLPEMRRLADRYGAALYLDDAHAMGVIGKTGRGTLEHYQDNSLAELLMCTFSKSFGSIGGFVAGDTAVVDYIKHFSRPLIFTASMPPANVAAAMKSLEIIQEEPDRVARLQEIARKMLTGFRDLGFDIGTAETPIVPLIIGEFEKTLLFWRALFEHGVYTNPILSPAVPPNRCLIRTSYMAIHTDEELDEILSIAGEVGRSMGII